MMKNMASNPIRIHEDSEKENPSHKPVGNRNKVHKLKEQRATLAVLGNIANNTNRVEATKKRTVFGESSQLNKNEKLVDKITIAAKKAENLDQLPVTQYKPFCVYEDSTDDNDLEAVKSRIEIVTAKICPPVAVVRNPLQEIFPVKCDEPMSVEKVIPMSLEKSLQKLEQEDEQQKLAYSQQRHECEIFFNVQEYQNDILEYLHASELKNRPKHGYMQRQPDINATMRTILVDWLVEVCEEYNLHSESLFLAVSYVDRFLSVMSVVRAKLQLVGTSAIFIAAKYEEVMSPDLSEFVYITDNTYTKKQVLRMEQLILKVLSFDLSRPTPLYFNNAYAIIHEMTDQLAFLSNYLSELSLLVADPFLKYLPSQISAASIALARYNLDLPIWSEELAESTGYTILDLQEIILHLAKQHVAATDLQQQAIQEKYRASRFLSVSTLNPRQLDAEQFKEAVCMIRS